MMRRLDEATAQMQKALKIDPHNPFTNTLSGILACQCGRYQDGIDQLVEVQAVAPNPLARISIGWARYQMGNLAEGIKAYEDYFTMLGDTGIAEAMRCLEEAGDMKGAARAAAELLAERSLDAFVKPINIVILFDWAGEPDRAFEWLEKAKDLRDHDVAYIATLPTFSTQFRCDSRFQTMLQHLDLPNEKVER
jgi:tetratricopeptide (TPR) repeat protein